MNILTNDTATGRGIRTAIQALIGFVIGLIIAVWTVPGVQQVVSDYLLQNLLGLTMVVGIPTGIASGLVGFLWNVFLRKDVKNI